MILRRSIVAGSILAVLLLCAATMAISGKPESNSPPQVEVTLSLDKSKCSPGEAISFTRVVRNAGKKPVSVFPFRYMNDNVRFYWVDISTLKTRRYGDGKDGLASPVELPAGGVKKEVLSDNVVSRSPGKFYVFLSCSLPNSDERLLSNVAQLEVLAKDTRRKGL